MLDLSGFKDRSIFSTFSFQILGSIYLLRGRILEALDNRPLASEAFKEALRKDSFCMEAFKVRANQSKLISRGSGQALLIPFEDTAEV